MYRGFYFLSNKMLVHLQNRNGMKVKEGAGASSFSLYISLYTLRFINMIQKETVQALVEEQLQLSESQSFLVDVMVKPGNLIVVEIDSQEGIDIAECIAISKHIEANLDREIEDYELEVGSAGVTSPMKVLKQFLINLGEPVELLSKQGQKLYGTLKDANEENFTVTITKKIKPEGAKRKIDVEEDLTFAHDEVKYVKYHMK